VWFEFMKEFWPYICVDKFHGDVDLILATYFVWRKFTLGGYKYHGVLAFQTIQFHYAVSLLSFVFFSIL